jgi:hypothetical protein
MTGGAHADSLGGAGKSAGIALVTIVAGSTALSPDVRQLRASAVLDLSGATRLQRRAVVLAEVLVLANVATLLGWVVGGLVANAAGNPRPLLSEVWVLTMLAACVAGLFGRFRTRVTAVDAQGHPTPGGLSRQVAPPRWRLLVVGGLLVWAGYALAASSRSFWDLDLTLWPGITLVGAGLAFLLPFLITAAAGVLGRLPWLAPNLAAGLLRSRRAILGPALVLGMVVAFAVAVQGILGAGLDEREQRRQARLDDYTFTAGLDPHDVIVGRSPGRGPFARLAWSLGQADADLGPLRLAPDAADRVRTDYPDATVTPIVYLPATAHRLDSLVPDTNGSSVALATPELLAATGTEAYADDISAGRAVALDPLAVRRGQAEIELFDVHQDYAASVGSVNVPAVVADLPSIPLELPTLLVPPDLDLGRDLGIDLRPGTEAGLGPHELIVHLPRPATTGDAFALDNLVTPGSEPDGSDPDLGLDVAAWTGSEVLTYPRDEGKLDAAQSVGLRQPGEARVAVGLVALVALIGLFVTLRLANATRRADEEVVESLGAHGSTLRRLAVVQATVVTALATSTGFAVGIALTWQGIARYNGEADLPPIPLIIPPVLWIGAVAVPALAGAIAWLLAWRRPSPGPAGLADGLLW